MQLPPDARLLPLDHQPIARRARAEDELQRQAPPGDPRVQHKQDPLQRSTIIEPLPTWIADASLPARQQRTHVRPQLVNHHPRSNSHRHPSQLDDGRRQRSPSGNGSLHFDSSSKTSTIAVEIANGSPSAVGTPCKPWYFPTNPYGSRPTRTGITSVSRAKQ